jgi:hypothetical protein
MGCRSRFATHSFVLLGFLIVFGGSVARAQLQPRVTQAIDNHLRITLAGNVHPLARPEFDHGTAGNAQPMTRMLLLLKRSDTQQAALSSFMEQQQDKSSPNYHAWLSPQDFGAQYGPADADIQAVSGWLASQGFTVNKVYSGKSIIEFSGNAGQVQQAFNTEIRKYEVLGKLYTANAQDPQIPAALAPVVSGIVSLNSFPRTSHARYLGVARRVAGKSGLQPLFTFPRPNGNGNFYGLGPGDFATIYNSQNLISGGNDGSGQTIAVVGETNINAQDVISFRSIFGLPTNFSASNIILNGEDPGITSIDEETEADLDVEWSGATAPGANVKFVVSASTPASQGTDLSALYIIEHNLAGVMSESYGFCEQNLGTAGNAFYNSLWEQAAAQGITAVVSSGDGGTAGCDDFNTQTAATGGLAVSGLSGTPFNVSVGGTDFDQRLNSTLYWKLTNNATTGSSAIGYIPEIPWNESCAQIGLTGCGTSAPNGSMNIVAGSGGQSTCANQSASGTCISGYPKPSWQMGVTGNDNHRDQPDISLFASPGFGGSGYLICQSDHTISGSQTCDLTNASGGALDFDIVGGTSASAPAFTGVMALVNQYQGAHGGSNRQGNANYVLYQLAKKTGASCASSATEATTCIFNDIVKGNSDLLGGIVGVGTNSVPCQPRSTNCSAVTGGNNGVLVDPAHTTAEAWTVAPGYDMVTGLGTVNVGNLATKWSTVSTVATTTTLTLTPQTSITHGTSENVNITVKPTSGTATGDVSLIAKFPDGTTQGLDGFTLAGGSITNGSTLSLPGGTYTVTAHYTGDGTNAPSDSPSVQVTVAAESSKTFASLVTVDINGRLVSFGASAATYGTGFNFFQIDVGDGASTVSPTAGISSNCSKGLTNCPTGTVTLNSTGTSLGVTSFSLNNLGYAVTQPLSAGSYSVVASYPGDTSYASSTGSASFLIAKAPTTITAGYAGTPVQYGNSEQIAVDVITNSLGAAPTGTFQFFVDGVPLQGLVPVYESFAYNPNSSGIAYAWADGATTTEFIGVGNHTMMATYSGDANYAPGSSATVTVPVSKALPFIGTFGASPATINLGQQTVLTAQMYGASVGAIPTGTFTFTDGATTVSGTAVLTPSGRGVIVTLPYTPTTIGTHLINASYPGDSNYLPTSTPVAATLTVVGPDFSMNPVGPASVALVAGNPANFMISISGSNGFTSNVAVTCSVPAAATTCSANPASVAPGGTTTITVTTMAHQLLPPLSRKPFTKFTYSPLVIIVWLVCTLLALLLDKSRTEGRRFPLVSPAFIAAGIFLLLLPIEGCGGSGGGGTPPPPSIHGTQPGTYTVTISATSGGTSPVTHTTSATLIVN